MFKTTEENKDEFIGVSSSALREDVHKILQHNINILKREHGAICENRDKEFSEWKEKSESLLESQRKVFSKWFEDLYRPHPFKFVDAHGTDTSQPAFYSHKCVKVAQENINLNRKIKKLEAINVESGIQFRCMDKTQELYSKEHERLKEENKLIKEKNEELRKRVCLTFCNGYRRCVEGEKAKQEISQPIADKIDKEILENTINVMQRMTIREIAKMVTGVS